ncbi:hypothetical protein MYX82_11745 [Acidobacteria bacterium AH-259-D05]|nr:hypothetical protein [Acidobacteria bacterium AH-259-D05]
MKGRLRSSHQLFLFFSVLLCVACSWAPAQNLREQEFISQARTGFEQLYNLDHNGAKKTFEALGSEYPDHPAPPLYVASVIWLHELFQRQELDLSLFTAPGYFTEATQQVMELEDRRAFFKGVEECQNLAQSILQSNRSHKDARYFMGLSYAILGSFSITVDRRKNQAFQYGKKAYKYHRELVTEDPDYYDAYMSVGVYEYIVDNLPWYIKWLAVIMGYRGSEEQAFEYLNLAAEKARYVSDDARIMLMVLWVREKQYQQALTQARLLHERYPRNYLFHLNHAQILERMGETNQAIHEYQQVLELAESNQPNYQKLSLASFRFHLGTKFMKLKHYELALEQFQDSIDDWQVSERQKALSHLRAGQIFDLQGKRDEAITRYKQVLRYEDFEDSRDQARKFIEDPYRE